MAVSDEQFNALSEEVKSLSDSIKGIGDTVANAVTEAVKPIKEHVDQIDAANKAKEEAELADLTAKIVKANLMDEDTAKELTLNAARALAKKAEPGKAAALNGASGGSGGDDDEWADYSLNAAIDGKKKEAA
jgi:ribosomal protein S13